MHTPGFIGVHAQELGARVVAARSHDPLGRLTCGLKHSTAPEAVRAVHRPDAAPTAPSVAKGVKTRVTYESVSAQVILSQSRLQLVMQSRGSSQLRFSRIVIFVLALWSGKLLPRNDAVVVSVLLLKLLPDAGGHRALLLKI